MSGEPISWDEIEAIFNRCGELHLSPNLAEGLAAQGIEAAEAAETVKHGSVHESPVAKRCAQEPITQSRDTPNDTY